MLKAIIIEGAYFKGLHHVYKFEKIKKTLDLLQKIPINDNFLMLDNHVEQLK